VPVIGAEGQPVPRVVIAEDSVLLREGLARVLTDAGIEVVGTAGEAARLLELVAQLQPDVVIADIRMPPTQTTEGLEAAREIRRSWPRIGVLLLSQHVETQLVIELLDEDPRGLGYLLKDRIADVAQFIDAVARIARGESVIDAEIVSRLVSRPRRQSPLERLTEREVEVLTLMAEGRSNQAISAQLFMAPKTVESHVGSIFTKLDLRAGNADHRRVLAVLEFLRA